MINSVLTIAYPGREYWYANRDTLVPSREHRVRGVAPARHHREHVGGACRLDARGVQDAALAPARYPAARPRPGLVNERLVDYRELSRELFTERRRLDDYLPALACWLPNDDREHLRLFGYMDDLQSYIADDYKFTLLHVNVDRTAAFYDIRMVTGKEQRQEDSGQE